MRSRIACDAEISLENARFPDGKTPTAPPMRWRMDTTLQTAAIRIILVWNNAITKACANPDGSFVADKEEPRIAAGLKHIGDVG